MRQQPADAIALDGLRRAALHIETATKDGSNKEARWNMMMAAMEGAMAFQKGLGAVRTREGSRTARQHAPRGGGGGGLRPTEL